MNTESTGLSKETQSATSANGSAWAALLAAGIGCTAFGLLTDLSECCARAAQALLWYRPSGSLSGVAISAIVIWLVAWAVLHMRWNRRQLQSEKALLIMTALLVVVGVVTTFPPFYELITPK